MNWLITSDGSGSYLQLRSGTTPKGFWGYSVSGYATLDLGGGNSIIQNVNEINSNVVQAMSSANPRTIDAPLTSMGGCYVSADLDVVGTAYLNSVYADNIRFNGYSGNAIAFHWNGANVKVYVDNTPQGTIPNP